MTAKLERLKADAPASDIVALLRRDGVAIVENLIDADVIARINEEVGKLTQPPSAYGTLLGQFNFFWGKLQKLGRLFTRTRRSSAGQ